MYLFECSLAGVLMFQEWEAPERLPSGKAPHGDERMPGAIGCRESAHTIFQGHNKLQINAGTVLTGTLTVDVWSRQNWRMHNE